MGQKLNRNQEDKNMPDKDETKTIDIKISDILIAKETENEIKTRVPRT